MISNKSVNILVVTHNHSQYIDSLIESLSKFNIEDVYFCDAKSTDDTLKKLLDSPYKESVLIKDTLESFSKNNNDLIRYFNLNSNYYLLLNPDTYFDENFIETLMRKVKIDPLIGIIAPVLRYPNGELQKTWKKFPNFFTVIKKRIGYLNAVDERQMSGPNIDWCLGACMLINSSLLKKGKTLLDERYRLYCEDIDICFESHQKNLKVIGDNEVYIYHNLNESSSKNIFSKYNLWNISSIIKFILKWNFKYFKKGI